MALEIGVMAPLFSAVNQDGDTIRLEDFRGKWVVLYFYPKDDTPGCTMEAKGFEQLREEFERENAVILGVSRDDVKSHKNFCTKYGLNFHLLADTDGKIIESYKAKGGLFTKRMTYLIDPEGKIAFVWKKVNPSGHAREVIEKLRELKNAGNKE
ncbi:MAG: peroxiredoxin [candidate division WOR-3 bacterium]